MTQTLPLLRLYALAGDSGVIVFRAEFAAPSEHTSGACAPASLDFGDGAQQDLGILCAPTVNTWREARVVELATHTYTTEGPHEARLTWGDREIAVTVPSPAPEPTTERPQILLFEVKVDEDDPLRASVHLKVSDIPAGTRLRVDGSAGQVFWLSPSEVSEQTAEWLLTYAKPGTYTVTADLVDEDGFWLATVAETEVLVGELDEGPEHERVPAVAAPPSPQARLAMEEMAHYRAELPVWIPFRYARPVWANARTYTSPGGGRISRILVPGTYISIHDETVVDGNVWYLTASNDWVPATSVIQIQPSNLRGVQLRGVAEPTPPPPPTPPEPTPVRHGVVTAYVLNVRARPGVRPDNPPIDRLRQGTEVTIYEEAPYNGEIWYRIGDNRWVHSGWVRIVQEPPTGTAPVRRGVVTAYVLNVRARPGVRPDNPPIDRLRQGTEVTIYEEAPYNGEIWYRIGDNRWVHSGWVRIVATLPRAASTPQPTKPVPLPVGWVVASSLNVRARPGVSDDNPPIDRLHYKDTVRILEEKVVQGATWYRIGDDRWVYGGWVGVARYKPRPSSIRPNERWVGVCLKEQTAVAYEGDEPVFAALVATGLPQTPTVQGIFRTWLRRKWGKMSGGAPGTAWYYYLEDVTWTMYFYQGYALHTAYWHDAFGRPRSHGCVNMSPYDAWWIFQWSAEGGERSPAVYVYWA